MERDIDMRQTVEEAALDAALFEDYCYNEDLQPYYIEGFKRGAEWQAKQSPWISVEERLPENQDIVLVRDEYGGKATAYLHGKDSGFIVYGEDAYKVFGEITHWMPIPDLEE